MTLSKKQRAYTNPPDYGLPYSGWRGGQTEAIEWLQKDNWLINHSDAPVKIIEAPTGSGKSGIILALSAMYPELRFLVLCATKLEQDQYEENITDRYKGFASIRGRANFHCILDEEDVSENVKNHIVFQFMLTKQDVQFQIKILHVQLEINVHTLIK